jgi:glycosyltransferase involved in cell wall biosynthesis
MWGMQGGPLTDALPRTLVVPLSGESAHATDLVGRLLGPADPVVFPLAQLANGGRRVLRDRRYDRLALVGAPPTDEIGYGLSALVALLGRPSQVALVDLEREELVFTPLRPYIARAAPFAVAQFASSVVALAAQRLALTAAGHPTAQNARAPELNKLLYLRPSVGSASTVGGSVTHSHEVIRMLQANGVKVEAYTTDAGIAATAAREPETPCRWHVVQVPRMVKAVPASAAAGGDAALVRAALPAARAADAIYQRHARFSISGALLARLTGKPLFLEYNGSEQFIGRYWNKTPLRRRLAACEDTALKAAARIVVVSDADRRALLERGVEPERLVLNPNGVDTERFAVGGGEAVRRRHLIDDDDIIIGFIGSFGPWHGAPVLARAFADIAASVPRGHLLLVGDGPELGTTRRIVYDAGLAERVTLAGQVLPGDVPGYLDACDILVSPHVPLHDGVEFFGSPTKLFEYMAAGKAIVASRLGQIGDVLEHGVTAWLVDPGDASGLAHALRALSEAPEIRRELGAKARRQAVTSHSWQLNVSRVIEAYASLAEGAH